MATYVPTRTTYDSDMLVPLEGIARVKSVERVEADNLQTGLLVPSSCCWCRGARHDNDNVQLH